MQDSCVNCGKKAYCVYVCDEPKLCLFQYHPHPYRMRLVLKGLSHELNKCPPDTCLPALRAGRSFESQLEHKNIGYPARGSRFFGARDGTRTHTALTTRTSNVLVYHSNTLASAPQYYTAAGTFCQYNFMVLGLFFFHWQGRQTGCFTVFVEPGTHDGEGALVGTVGVV